MILFITIDLMSLYIFRHNQPLNTIPEKLNKDDAIILIEDAVYQSLLSLQSNAQIFVLKEDLQARGLLEKASNHFSCIDYAGFVELSETHQRIITL